MGAGKKKEMRFEKGGKEKTKRLEKLKEGFGNKIQV